MKTISVRSSRLAAIGIFLLALLAPGARCQVHGAGSSAVVQGTVSDSELSPLKDADVSLESADHAHKFVTRSDAHGRYLFAGVPPGSYALHGSKTGYLEGDHRPFVLSADESKIVDVRLSKAGSASAATQAFSVGQFSDEPHFQIAGIADPNSYGGHGSETALRTKEALAKDTDSLSRETSTQPGGYSAAGKDGAEMHRQRGDAAEKEGHALEAVREYQLAAELEPSEANLFAWGAELLLHRALEPALEVFAKGQRLFPGSVRMAVGLSMATYHQGATERSAQLLLRACDINPADPTPYLFMGRLEEGERIEISGWTEKLHRFSLLDPDNPLAHYYYAVALSNRSQEPAEDSAMEAELKRAIALDPKLGAAYLQLGRLYAARKDHPAAIAAFEKAIANLALPDEAHYRLAQVYRQMGDPNKARQEIALYKQTSQKRTRQEQERRQEIQRFVYTLGGQKPNAPSLDAKPR
jgi:tetratricopeptide (TPR) repeat protein